MPLPPTRERHKLVSPASDGSVAVRSKGRRILKVIFFTLCVLFAVALGGAVTAAFLAKEGVDRLLTPKTAAVAEAQKQLTAALPGKPATILVLGSDKRAGGGEGDQRSDTMLLVRMDPKKKTVSMLSFPRDLYVPIPGHGQSKINDAYSLGGPSLTVQTLKELTGLDVNFIVNVDFRGFRGIIDTLGGVYMDVDQRYFHDESQGGNYAEIDIEPGYQLLGGRDALAFSRFRHTDSDFYRIARQQLMLEALKKQVGASRVAKNINGLFDVLYKNTDMATGGNGKVSTRTMVSYIRLALSLKGSGIHHFEVPGRIGTAGAASIVEYDKAAVDAAVEGFMNPNLDEQAETLDAIGTPSGSTVSAINKRVVVQVQNGNGDEGAADRAIAVLATAGVTNTKSAGNADNFNHANTKIYYRRDEDKKMAEQIGKKFKESTVDTFPATLQSDARMLVIVGKTGLPDTTVTTSPKVVEKAQVVTDKQYAFDAFFEIRGTIKIPVQYPTVREMNSTLQFPVRTYKIPYGKEVYDAYRIVGKTSNDYWGLQATNWPNPPILEHPNKTVSLGGRSVDLYLDGSKIHMIAWRQNGATYWVTNTLLNKLNNPTMLAIAEGVRPINSKG